MATAGLTQYLMENPLYAAGGAIGQEGTKTTPVRTAWEGLARALQGGIGGLSQGYAMQNAKDEQTLDQKTLGEAMQLYRTDQPAAKALLATRPHLADTTNALLMQDVGYQKQLDLLKAKDDLENQSQQRDYAAFGFAPGGASAGTGGGAMPAPAPAGGGVNPHNIGNVRPAGASTGFQQPASFDDGVALAIKNVKAYPGAFNGNRPMSLLQIGAHWAPVGDGANDPGQWARNVGAIGGIDPAAPLDFNDPNTAAAFARGLHGAEHGAKALRAPGDYMPGVANALQLGPRASVPPQLAQLPPMGAPGGPSAMPQTAGLVNPALAPGGAPPAPMPQPAGASPPGPPPAPMPAPPGAVPPGPPPAPMPGAPPAGGPLQPGPTPDSITFQGVQLPRAAVASALMIKDKTARQKALADVAREAVKQQQEGLPGEWVMDANGDKTWHTRAELQRGGVVNHDFGGQYVRDAKGVEHWTPNAKLAGTDRYEKPPEPGTEAGDVHVLENGDDTTREYAAAHARIGGKPIQGANGVQYSPNMGNYRTPKFGQQAPAAGAAPAAVPPASGNPRLKPGSGPGGSTPLNERNYTVDQTKDHMFSTQLDDAIPQLEALVKDKDGKYTSANLPGSTERTAANFNVAGAGVPESLVPGAAKSFRQIEQNILTGTLRVASGATINPSEFVSERQKFIPTRGDSPALVKQKMVALKKVARAMAEGTGREMETYKNLNSYTDLDAAPAPTPKAGGAPIQIDHMGKSL